MTNEEIKSLRAGDIILVNRSGGYLRTVLVGPADYENERPARMIQVARMKRSQYHDIGTYMDTHFLRTHCTYTGMKAKKFMGGDELSRLIDMGFDVAREIIKEVKDAAETKVRMAEWGHLNRTPEQCQRLTRRALKAVSEYKGLQTA